ncbi:MAG: TRAP transporter large permease subunit, partial [Rhodoferax sp.]|nr:TRAP transporter large permease subunit [Rhodoferax sp.]
QTIAATMLSISTNKYVIIILINVLLLIVGMFMETIAALIILFPPLLAVAVGVGIDPIHFATFAVLNLMIGLTTPPVGICLFVCANIAKAPLSSVIKEVLPFLAGNLVVLMLVSFIPQLSLWLPNMLFGAK